MGNIRKIVIVIISLTALAMASAASCQSGPGDIGRRPLLTFAAVVNVASVQFEFGNTLLNQLDTICRAHNEPSKIASIGLYLVAADVKCMSLGIRFQRASQAP